jgi:hypothetical protein
MHQDTHGWVTVHDVAKDMGVELDDVTAWSVGAQVAAAWGWQSGTPPLKDLRTKKKGAGSHCFALYPPAFRKRMELIIRAYRPPGADQLALF